jgi:hypothetical protein
MLPLPSFLDELEKIAGLKSRVVGAAQKLVGGVKEQAGAHVDTARKAVEETAQRVQHANQEAGRAGARAGVSEGLKDLSSELWAKHKKKALGVGAAAAGLAGANKAVNYGLDRHRDKLLAKDIADRLREKE